MRAMAAEDPAMRLLPLLLTSLIGLAACGEDFIDPQAEADAAKKRTPKAGMLDDQKRYIERAEAVEDDVMENKARQDAAVEAATGG